MDKNTGVKVTVHDSSGNYVTGTFDGFNSFDQVIAWVRMQLKQKGMYQVSAHQDGGFFKSKTIRVTS